MTLKEIPRPSGRSDFVFTACPMCDTSFEAQVDKFPQHWRHECPLNAGNEP